MKKLFMTFLLFTGTISLFGQEVQLQFISVNDYGNNLYIDNVTLGSQKTIDIGVSSINNLLADTNYIMGSSSFVVAPNVTFINVGKNHITSPFNVTMTVTPGTYSSTKSIASLNSGQSAEVTFDNLTVTPSSPMNILITTNLAGDENPANNSLAQFTQYFPGVDRNILFEEWTSSTCGPCASNNPTIDAFVSARFDSIVPIKYHMNWPSPGNDPMYAHNPDQANDRRFYYGVNAVPHVIMDGVVNPSYPYSNAASLPDAYIPRKAVGSPISMTVTDTRLPGDTIKTEIAIQIVAPLKAGQYYLRVHAVERKITYATAPGSNGETIFYDVFRRAFPTSLGTVIPTAVGTHNFSFKYKLDTAVWVDSMIYTAAFIQNDATKEVVNSAKGRRNTFENILTAVTPPVNVERPIPDDKNLTFNNSLSLFNQQEALAGTFGYEFFEAAFPSPGWRLVNPDGSTTFAQYTGANGPSFGGSKSVMVEFYNYSSRGRADTLYSKIYSGLSNTDTLKFDWAYAQYSTTYVDRLVVKLSQDGGATFPYTIFDKSGSTLATAPTTTNSFIPIAGQWGSFNYVMTMLVPVELTSFTAAVSGNDVNLNWSTASETNNLGFEVQRKMGNEFVTIGYVKGNGTTAQTHNYSYIDKELPAGKYAYRLRQVDYNGAYEYSQIAETTIEAPKVFSLEQNYPNPFNPSTKISWQSPVSSRQVLKVFDVLGNEVATLLDEYKPEGNYEVEFFANEFSSGIYYYQLKAGDFIQTKKMILIK